MRIERPEELAAFVLRGQTQWDAPRIREAMDADVEKQVALKHTLPVHIVYMTAWVDDTGTVQFAPDIYGLDTAQLKLD